MLGMKRKTLTTFKRTRFNPHLPISKKEWIFSKWSLFNVILPECRRISPLFEETVFISSKNLSILTIGGWSHSFGKTSYFWSTMVDTHLRPSGKTLHRFEVRALKYFEFVSFSMIIGITAGAHRLWCHRGYKATWQLKLILTFFNTIAHQQGISYKMVETLKRNGIRLNWNWFPFFL